MRDSCLDLGSPGYDTDYGWGMVNAGRLVAMTGIFVDGSYTGTAYGTPSHPYRTVTAAVDAANSAETTNIFVRGGNYNEQPTITKKVQILNWGNVGTVTIGMP